MRSTQSVLPDVDPRLRQHGFTSGRQGYSGALWWISVPGQGGEGLKRDTLYLHLYTKQAFGSTGQEDSVFHLKSVSAELFSNWDPKEQLPHEHKNVQKTIKVNGPFLYVQKYVNCKYLRYTTWFRLLLRLRDPL